jgi:hypothetical protein
MKLKKATNSRLFFVKKSLKLTYEKQKSDIN